MSAATRAPHTPQTPAPWYINKLPDAKNLVKRPDFNYTSSAAVKTANSGHASWIEDEPPVTMAEAKVFDQQFGDCWQQFIILNRKIIIFNAAIICIDLK